MTTKAATRGAALPVPPLEVVKAAREFHAAASYLSHPEVPYEGTANGDSPEAWEGRFWAALCATVLRAAGVALGDDAQAAVRTLECMGYTYHGAELWEPPLGPTEPIGWTTQEQVNNARAGITAVCVQSGDFNVPLYLHPPAVGVNACEGGKQK